MSKKMLFYIGLILVISNLFYQEKWGLNALILSVVFIIVSAINKTNDPLSQPLRSAKWYFAASLFITNGFAVFYIHSIMAGVFYFLSFLFYIGVHNKVKLSLPIGLVQSMQSFITGFFHFFELLSISLDKTKKKNTHKTLIRLLIVSIPLIIAIVFLKLYQNADDSFYEMTKFINLDWISWGFILFYVVKFLAFFGFFFYHQNKGISAFEDSLKNDIESDYTDKVEKFMGIGNEKKIALSLLITLNIMLLLYNFIDLKFVLIDLPNPSLNLRYSDLIHGGVNSLITSIVLVIIILTFIYRGQLNFQGSKAIRLLALVWLLQNLVMVGTTIVKNYEYIAHWGLTYKRIGVYIYLLLAAAGLFFTIVKIIRVKSIWFLIRNTSLAFFTCFTLMGLFNWNEMIVKHNLSQIKSTNIDFNYLFSLGGDCYPDLMDYYNANKGTSEISQNPYLWHNLFEYFDAKRDLLKRAESNFTWRSMNLRDRKLLKRMNKYNLVYKRTPDRESWD